MENQRTTPVPVQRSTRTNVKRVATTGRAGKILPIAVVPLLMEDEIRRGRMTVRVKLRETVEPLFNGVQADVRAYFVPKLALDRFSGMDSFLRSYKGEQEKDGTVIPFFETALMTDWRNHPVFNTLGLHAPIGQEINTDYLESYNQMVNFRRKNVSRYLPLRDLDEKTCAEAFWPESVLDFIVPDFDAAAIDGEVPLRITQTELPVTGVGIQNAGGTPLAVGTVVKRRNAEGEYVTSAASQSDFWKGADANTYIKMVDTANGYWPDISAQLSEQGVMLSLSKIDEAKKTAAFARLRKEFAGLDDEYIIELLMSGVRVPEQYLRQPMLVAKQTVMFGFQQRFATSSGALAESVTEGFADVNLNIRVPQTVPGGVIFVTVEVVPERLFERRRDPYFYARHAWELPEFQRDFLDSQKVTRVLNRDIDTSHSDPAGTFGYAPLNYQWQSDAPSVGGEYYRPETEGEFDEQRQAIWSVEGVNPTLNEKWYMAGDLHQKPFEYANQDVVEVVARGTFVIEGNTVFGPKLYEGQDYDKIRALAPIEELEVE